MSDPYGSWGGVLLRASTGRLEGLVSLWVGELEMEDSRAMEAAPLWVSPTHCYIPSHTKLRVSLSANHWWAFAEREIVDYHLLLATKENKLLVSVCTKQTEVCRFPIAAKTELAVFPLVLFSIYIHTHILYTHILIHVYYTYNVFTHLYIHIYIHIYMYVFISIHVHIYVYAAVSSGKRKPGRFP